MRRSSWIILIVLSLALSVAVPIVLGGAGSLSELTRLSPLGIAMLLGMMVLTWVFNALRVRILAHGVGHRVGATACMTASVATEFASVASPAGTGGPPTYLYVLSRDGLPSDRAAAVVTVDHFVDVVFFATAVPLVLVLVGLDQQIAHPWRLLATILAVVAVGTIGVLATLRYYRPVLIKLGKLMHHLPRFRRVRYRLARWIVRFRHSLRMLLTIELWRLLFAYLFAIGHWVTLYSVLFVLLYLLGSPVPWGYLFLAQALAILIGKLTFLPGGSGGVELSFSGLLQAYLDPVTTATALLIWRVVTFHWRLLIGAPVFALATGGGAWSLVSSRSRDTVPADGSAKG